MFVALKYNEHILLVIHYSIYGAVCFQFSQFPRDGWENILFCLIIIIKSEVWTIIHCLGLGHETMVCAVCLFIWVRSRNCGCLVTWFCYQLIAKPGNKTAAVSWPDPYSYGNMMWCIIKSWINRDSLCFHVNINGFKCKTAVTPLLTHWSYCSLALSHWYMHESYSDVKHSI